jgi:hypothetical protein
MSHQHPSRIFCVVIFGQKYLLLSEEQTISTGNPGGKINNFSELSVFSPLFQWRKDLRSQTFPICSFRPILSFHFTSEGVRDKLCFVWHRSLNFLP